MTSERRERIALNESAFRELNERLQANVHRGDTEPEYAGFVCECGDGDCDTTIRMTLPDYERVRADSLLFFVVPGHEAADTEDIVEDGDGYRVVRKHDDVADIVDSTDPRS